MPFVKLVVTPSSAASRDAMSAALFGAGALGLQEEGDAWVTVLTSSSEDAATLDRLFRWTRRVLGELRADVAERVAYKNAAALFHVE